FKAVETEVAESVASCLSKEREKEILENRQYVKALLKTTALLGRQGLAFRGHDEGESSANQGNFVETVHLLTEINPDLMKNSRKAYGHYMSHEYQNDYIEIYVSCIIGLAICAPLGTYDDSRTSTTVVPILKQINQVSNDGSYTFGYEAGDGSFKAKKAIKLTNAEEDLSTDVDENGFQDALQNLIPNLKGASVAAPVAPVADKAPVPTAVPMPQQQRIVPIYTVVRQISPSSSQSDPNTFINQSIMALALCAPPSAREESRTSTNQAQILKQINHVNDDGLYTFGYEAGNSTFKAKETMSLPSTDENFSPDADKNGIQGTLENAIPNLKAVLNPTLVAPVVGPVHAAAPVPHQQQIAPIFTLARQTSDTNNQSDPSAIIKQAPQGYQFSFVAPTQNTKMEHLNQARTLLHTLPQLVAYAGGGAYSGTGGLYKGASYIGGAGGVYVGTSYVGGAYTGGAGGAYTGASYTGGGIAGGAGGAYAG
ncbi:hypothetical protein QYM36_003826, partial [Artemia franciscana]